MGILRFNKLNHPTQGHGAIELKEQEGVSL